MAYNRQHDHNHFSLINSALETRPGHQYARTWSERMWELRGSYFAAAS